MQPVQNTVNVCSWLVTSSARRTAGPWRPLSISQADTLTGGQEGAGTGLYVAGRGLRRQRSHETVHNAISSVNPRTANAGALAQYPRPALSARPTRWAYPMRWTVLLSCMQAVAIQRLASRAMTRVGRSGRAKRWTSSGSMKNRHSMSTWKALPAPMQQEAWAS